MNVNVCINDILGRSGVPEEVKVEYCRESCTWDGWFGCTWVCAIVLGGARMNPNGDVDTSYQILWKQW